MPMSELFPEATPVEEVEPDRQPEEWPFDGPITYDDVDGEVPNGFGPIDADTIPIDD